ncbi:MAG: F0F1 ATP synthase subunit B [Firmicutes bacterium]|nr:F0F1 ATP synthase subunit B [Bacillota bacterium]MBQ3611504.1 F0F1 ATP synthase subunit B [Bacillota bacterium]MDO4424996.1 F0F1 ATP synthase subunit B [Planctomycetia bacterium]
MVEALGISLTEFIFYLINFLILVGALGKFLYKPFLELMDNRKQSIQDALDNAEMTNRRADEKMQNYNKRIARVEEEGREIIREAKQKADMQAAAIIEEANSKATDIILKAEQSIEREKEKAMEEMRQEIAALAILVAEKIVEQEIQRVGQEAIVDEVIKQARSTGWQS